LLICIDFSLFTLPNAFLLPLYKEHVVLFKHIV